MRELLPQRRRSLTYQATIGYYPDGRPGEIFLDCSKSGADVQIAARDSAIIAAFALQHGVSIEAMRRALTRTPNGEAEGPLGRLFDLLARRPRIICGGDAA